MRATTPARSRHVTATGESALRRLRWLALPLAAAGAVISIASVAFADSGQVSPAYQGYSSPNGGQDPYSNDTSGDIHVDGFGGQPVVDGEVVLNLDSLPSGSTVEGMVLQLTPNTSSTDNVNASGAAIEACPLDHPITSNGYQSTQPTYDCNSDHAAGELQPDGRWFFDIASIAQTWMKTTNTGLALIAYAPPNDTGQSVSPSAWSVGFDHTKTVATVDYTPGATVSVTVPAPNGQGTTTSVFPAAPVAGVPPPVAPAAPTATSSSTMNASPAPASHATTPVTGTLAAPAAARNQWLWLGVGLFAAAVLLVLVGAGQQVLRGAPAGAAARMLGALQSSRSQFATPLAVLTLAGVCALGFAGQTLSAASALNGGGAGASTGGGGGGISSGGGGTNAGISPGASAQAGVSGGGGGVAGGAGGSSGGGAAAAALSNDNGQDGPGVTHTTVRIGFIYVTNQNAANSAFGVQVASPGNEQSEEQTLVNYINAHGGIAGRQIQPIYVAVDNAQAEADPTIGEATCKQLTEDYHVWAVVAGAGAPDDQAANQCYASHGTINFDADSSEFGSSWLRSAAPYIWYVSDSALDRTMRWEIAGLGSRGFFSGSPKLGVVVAGDATNDSIYQDVTLPALESAGESASAIDKQDVPYASLDQAANGMKQVVVRYQAEGITNVIFQGGGADGTGSFAILFMLSAESQHFTPRYGLSSDDAPSALVTNIPQDQFNGALSIGIEPGADTDDAHYHAYPYGADQTTCNSLESAAGNAPSGQQGALAIDTFCDIMFDLQQAGQPLTGGALNAQLWSDQAMKASHLFDATMYARSYGQGKWDGAGGYRELHAVQNCETGSSGQAEACFEYDNGNIYS